MNELTVIVTACGCPGASTLIRKLKENGERPVRIVGTDMDPEAIGRFMADAFHRTPRADDPDYISTLLRIAEEEHADVLFPESTVQVGRIAENKHRFEEMGVAVVVAPPDAIATANNKWRMYRILEEETDIDLPPVRWPRDVDEFVDAARELGYPDRPVCFKPHFGKGSRGFRIIDPEVDRYDLLMNQKPNSRYIAMEEVVEILSGADSFPDLVLQPFYEGREYTTDSISLDGELLFCTAKTVEEARWGVIVRGELVERPELVEQTRKIIEAIPLDYCANIQFIEDKLIEINPRVSTFIYQDDLVAPYLAVKLALGEMAPDEVKACQDRVDIGRRMVRYMDQVFFK